MMDALKGITYTPSREYYEIVRRMKRGEAPRNVRTLDDMMFDRDPFEMYGLAQQGVDVPYEFRRG